MLGELKMDESENKGYTAKQMEEEAKDFYASCAEFGNFFVSTLGGAGIGYLSDLAICYFTKDSSYMGLGTVAGALSGALGYLFKEPIGDFIDEQRIKKEVKDITDRF
jgi:hypothetical protein